MDGLNTAPGVEARRPNKKENDGFGLRSQEALHQWRHAKLQLSSAGALCSSPPDSRTVRGHQLCVKLENNLEAPDTSVHRAPTNSVENETHGHADKSRLRDGPSPLSWRTPLRESASWDTVATTEDFSSSSCVNGKVRLTAQTTLAGSSSTDSLSTGGRDRSRLLSTETVAHPLSVITKSATQSLLDPSPPSTLQESKCVLGSLEDADHSNFHCQNETLRTEPQRPGERCRRLDPFFGSASAAPIPPRDSTASDVLSLSNVRGTTAPLLQKSASSDTVLGSVLASISLSHSPPTSAKSRKFADIGPRSAAGRHHQQNAAEEDSSLPRRSSRQAIAATGQTCGVMSCGAPAPRPTRCRQNASCTSRARRRPSHSLACYRDAKSSDLVWKPERSQELGPSVPSSSFSPSPTSSPSSSSWTFSCSTEECASGPASALQEEATENEGAGRLRKSACSTTAVATRRQEGEADCARPLLAEKVCAQEATQQPSEPVAGILERELRSVPRQTSLTLRPCCPPHVAIPGAKDKLVTRPLRRTPTVLNSVDSGRAAACDGRSSVSDVLPHTRPHSLGRASGPRLHRGEHAAAALQQVQQLQLLFKKQLDSGNRYRRKSLQHHFRQLQNALHLLLSPSQADSEKESSERLGSAVQFGCSSKVSGESPSPATCVRSSAPPHLITSGAAEPGNHSALQAEDTRSVPEGDSVAERRSLHREKTDLTVETGHGPLTSEKQADCVTPRLSHSYGPGGRPEQQRSTSADVQAQSTWKAGDVGGGRARREQGESPKQSTQSPGEKCLTENSVQQPAPGAYDEERAARLHPSPEGGPSTAGASDTSSVSFRHARTLQLGSTCAEKDSVKYITAASAAAAERFGSRGPANLSTTVEHPCAKQDGVAPPSRMPEASQPSRKSPARASRCATAQQEDTSSAARNTLKMSRTLRDRRRRKVICFRVRSRRRRPRRIRHRSPGPKPQAPTAPKLIGAQCNGGESPLKVKSSCHAGALARPSVQLAGDRDSQSSERKARGFSESGVPAGPGTEVEDRLSQAPWQPGDAQDSHTIATPSLRGNTGNQTPVETSSEPAGTRATEAETSAGASALSGAKGAAGEISAQHPVNSTKGTRENGAGGGPEVSSAHESPTRFLPATCKDGTSDIRAAAAASVSVEFVHALRKFVDTQFADRQEKDAQVNEDRVDGLAAPALQGCLKKEGESSSRELGEGAHPGVLLASCLGMMAGHDGLRALRDMCTLLITSTAEPPGNNAKGNAENAEGGMAPESGVPGRVTEATANAISAAHTQRDAGAPSWKACVPPGGRTAGRAAARFAQKERRKEQDRKHAEGDDGMQEECRNIERVIPSSAMQHKSTSGKASCCAANAGMSKPLRKLAETSAQPVFREGGEIRCEPLRTAKIVALQKEKGDSAAVHQTETACYNSSRDDAEPHPAKGGKLEPTVAQPHEPRCYLNERPPCSRSKAAVNSHLKSSRAKTSETCSQPLASRRKKAPLGRGVSAKEPCKAENKSVQSHESAPRSQISLTDAEGMSAEELPSFEDIFSIADLIPEAWYEEADKSGNTEDPFSGGGAKGGNTLTSSSKAAGEWVLEPETSVSPFDAAADADSFQPGCFSAILSRRECCPPSSVPIEETPGVTPTVSPSHALWNVPDDLVELIDSVPGGSPSALRPPCALRLLPTSSSSSSCSEPTSPSSPNPSRESSSKSSSSSSSSSESSPSPPCTAAASPRAGEDTAEGQMKLPPSKKLPVNNCPPQLVTGKQKPPAGIWWTFESSSGYEGETDDDESSRSEAEHTEELTRTSRGPGAKHICRDGKGESGEAAGHTTLNYMEGVGFFQRALADVELRNRLTQPLPEFISLYHRKKSLSPSHKQKMLKARGRASARRSRTQRSPADPSVDRAKKRSRERRRQRREECLKQRLAALHRDNLSHEEYMGQFARRMSLSAVHKVFCIELTKAEVFSQPSTVRTGDGTIESHISAHPAAKSAFLTPVASPRSTTAGWFPCSQAQAAFSEGRVCNQEKRAPSLCRAPPTQPVLTIEGCIADQLHRRGWVMNRLMSDSHFFDLKWKLTDVDEDYRSLRREQFFNHFQNNRVITTKGGLARSLHRLAVDEQVNVDLFFPRCYHLSSLDECSDFLLDYSRCEALTVLLAYLRCYQATPEEFCSVMAAEKLPPNATRRSAALLLWMAYHIAFMWLHELNPDLYLDKTESLEQDRRLDPQRLEVFASHAWQFRSQPQAFMREWHAIAQCEKALRDTVQGGDTSEDEKDSSSAKCGKGFFWSSEKVSRAPLGSQVLRLLKQLQTWWPLWKLERGNINLGNLKAGEKETPVQEEATGGEEAADRVAQTKGGNSENFLSSSSSDPCWKQHNVWIMKPSSNSKASGIHCLDNPWEILRAGRGLSDRLIQKYVERPLLLPCGRKFDMRQWVLVRSFDPLQVYVFSTLYLRLCSETYDLRDLQNRFRHVSNRHLNKLNGEVQPTGSNPTAKDAHVCPAGSGANHAVTAATTGLDICQPLAELEAMLLAQTGDPRFFQKNVMPQIRHIVLQTVRAARPSVISRPNSFELYGFDILLDEAYRAWLIEVNLSPACAASADWQQQMVKRMTSELLDLLFKGDTQRAVRMGSAKVPHEGTWTLVFDESVDPSQAVHTFPPIEPTDKTLATSLIGAREDNPFLQFYSQPYQKQRASRLAGCVPGEVPGMSPACTRFDDKAKCPQMTNSAAAGWDKMAVVGEHLSRPAETALNTWCRVTEAANRIVGWWRRTAWKRRAARRVTLALCEDVEVGDFFGGLHYTSWATRSGMRPLL